ncbi:hypothetical protein B0T18DRAFT_145218 [Schizothecium vesticola]|uniref:Uncharacterized protein n=1 Tax=Schizothecium vesticola TaxID=314040 RepID=A0AA40K514_9PEZI|nr:hypothetical protein B0T18DRAFT_145218 [Schizothecium vesticola]
MDRPRDFGGSPSPTPPLALSDLLNQRPFPPYTPPYERPVTSPDTTFAEADEQSTHVVASGHETAVEPEPQEPPKPPSPPPIPVTGLEGRDGSKQLPPPSVANWLTYRTQLRPSKNQGNKADWIRGWSQGVTVYGEETYCACSDAVSIGEKGAESKGGVRSILKGRRPGSGTNSGLITNNTESSTNVPETDCCRTCHRQHQPPIVTPGTGWGGMDLYSKVNLGKKINGLLQRAIPKRRRDAGGEDTSEEKVEPHPAIPLSETVRFDMSPNKPKDEKARRDLDGDPKGGRQPANPGHRPTMVSTGHRASPFLPSPDSLSDSGSRLRSDDALARRMSRLQRASALLQRMGQRNE